MPDNPSKLQNIQLTGEPSDGLGPRVVEPDGSAGGAIPDGGIPCAAEQNIERRPCDCEYMAGWHPDYFCILRKVNKPLPKYRYCRYRQRDGA